jgi:hypothetical protein
VLVFDAKILALVLASACGALAAGDVAEEAKQRNQAYGDELEQYFRDYLVTQYPARAAMAWHPIPPPACLFPLLIPRSQTTRGAAP